MTHVVCMVCLSVCLCVGHDNENCTVSCKGVDLAGFLGIGVQGRTPGRKSGGQSPPEAEVFFVKLHIIFALKYNKQRMLGDITINVPLS